MRLIKRGYAVSYPFLFSIVLISQFLLMISFNVGVIGLDKQIAYNNARMNESSTLLMTMEKQAQAEAKAAKLAAAKAKKAKEAELAKQAEAKRLAAQTPVVTRTIPQLQPARPQTPYSLTHTGVATDISSIGYTQSGLRSRGIEVIGHNGAIPKRCSSGQMNTTYTQGLAIKNPYTYPACPDGGSPLYGAYRPAGYSCSVIYNRNAGNRLAILAHEVSHCVYFQKGQYRAFDIEYKKIRNVSSLNRTQLNEIIADDMMICKHGLDTNWGSASYYNLYGVSRPDSALCSKINNLITKYL